MPIQAASVKVINDTPLQKIHVINSGQKISVADILLNGQKIRISGNFHDIARQINRFKARTGVTAEIHITKGKERLVLKIDNPKLLMVDKTGALAGYISAYKMGVGADKLIEIAGKNKKITPVFIYSIHETKKTEYFLSGSLSGTNIIYLSALYKKSPQQVQQRRSLDNAKETIELLPMVLNESENLKENEGPNITNVEEFRDRNAIIKDKLLEASKQVAQFIGKQAYDLLSAKSKKITNDEDELVNIIQNNLIGSDLGETYLRRNLDRLAQGISDSIDSKKSFFLISSTYSLTQKKIDEATCSAIDTAKLNVFNSFTDNIIKSFKKNGYTVSTTNAKNIRGAINNGLSKMQNIIFEDFYIDSKRIGKWIFSEILTKAVDQNAILNNKIVLNSNNARVLSRNISIITKENYQTV